MEALESGSELGVLDFWFCYSTCCVALDKLLNLSELQFPDLDYVLSPKPLAAYTLRGSILWEEVEGEGAQNLPETEDEEMWV